MHLVNTDQIDHIWPMNLIIDQSGHISHVGKTLAKCCSSARHGHSIFDVLSVSRPAGIADWATLKSHMSENLRITLSGSGFDGFKGVMHTLGDHYILQLQLGTDVVAKIKAFDLLNADFSAADPTLDLLYLLELHSLFFNAATSLANRMYGDKQIAQKEATSDPLTGLCNRRALEGHMKRLLDIEQPRPFGVMLIDLDFFKAANDTYGHAAGDHVLIHVAKCLKQQTRTSDLVARIGGDEFVIVFGDVTDELRLEEIAQRIVAKLAEPIQFEDANIQIGASIGISQSGAKKLYDSAALLDQADQALYQSKAKGRGCFSRYAA